MHVRQFATKLDPVWVRRVAESAPPPWGPMGYVVYKRTYSRSVPGTDRTEQLHETLERCINAVLEVGGRFTVEEAQRLFLACYQLQCLPGGRMLWQLGTPTFYRLGGDSCCNCWWVDMKRGWHDFTFAFDRLMLGGGVGFAADASSLPRVWTRAVTHVPDHVEATWQVPDSREGWTELFTRTYSTFFNGAPSFTYGTRLVRPAGSPIHGFGGVASGPSPLVEGHAEVCRLLVSRAGGHLSSVDVVDIHTTQGTIVVSGNVRRSALLGLGRGDDVPFLRAKRWDLGHVPSNRDKANLTCHVDDIRDLHPDYWHAWEKEGEQFGLFNGRLIQTTDPQATGVNPCAEANLRSCEPCDLVEHMMPKVPDLATFVDNARLLYRVAKTVLQLPFIDPETARVVRENQRIGCGVTGLRGAKFTPSDYAACYQELRAEDVRYSHDIGANESVKLTVVKPSGTLSLLAGVQPGVHGDVDVYTLRRMRIAAGHPLAAAARGHGFLVEPALDSNGVVDARTDVIAFPLCGGVKAGDAIEQLEFHRTMQRCWADQSVSVTVGFDQPEVPRIREWLEANYRDGVKTVSFMRNYGHGFTQTPIEPISKCLYRLLHSLTRPIVNVDGVREEIEVDTSAECVGDVCPSR